MLNIILNTLISAAVIGLAAWLANAYPGVDGFVVALPLAALLALPMAHAQNDCAQQMQRFALSILVAVPVVMLFLVPFVRARTAVWPVFLGGVSACGCLVGAGLVQGFFLHRWLMGFIG
jgi:hypothetical protein